MILVDTNIWIDFFKGKIQFQILKDLLEQERVQIHPFILAELSLGDFGVKRGSHFQDLREIPFLSFDYDFDCLNNFVEDNELFGTGLSFVDVELLRACSENNSLLWTQDKILFKFASKMKLEFRPHSS